MKGNTQTGTGYANLMGISPHGYTKRPRQAEICKLEVVAFVN